MFIFVAMVTYHPVLRFHVEIFLGISTLVCYCLVIVLLTILYNTNLNMLKQYVSQLLGFYIRFTVIRYCGHMTFYRGVLCLSACFQFIVNLWLQYRCLSPRCLFVLYLGQRFINILLKVPVYIHVTGLKNLTGNINLHLILPHF